MEPAPRTFPGSPGVNGQGVQHHSQACQPTKGWLILSSAPKSKVSQGAPFCKLLFNAGHLKLCHLSVKSFLLKHGTHMSHRRCSLFSCLPELLNQLEKALHRSCLQGFSKQALACKRVAALLSCTAGVMHGHSSQHGKAPSEDENDTAGGQGSARL